MIPDASGRNVPDAYLPLIAQMRFFLEPEISCSRFFAKACFTEPSLVLFRNTGFAHELERTEMGDFLAQRLQSATFFDIPCGLHALRDQEEDFDIVPLAFALGIQECIEVDVTAEVIQGRIARPIDVIRDGIYRLTDEDGPMGTRTTDGKTVTTIQDELLGFLAKMDEQKLYSKKALYLSGIQPDAAFCKSIENQRDVAIPYLNALYDELSRVTNSGDLVILNSSTMLVTGIDETLSPHIHPTLALPPRGFTLMRRCAYDKVQVFVKA